LKDSWSEAVEKWERIANDCRMAPALGGCEVDDARRDAMREFPNVVTALKEWDEERKRLEQKLAFDGYGDDPKVLKCGHGRWSTKGDCITCLSFAIDSLNSRLSETTQKLTLAESQLSAALQRIERLKKYASHSPNCFDKNCTCGLTALLTEAPEQGGSK
jgi:hypothetical protein